MVADDDLTLSRTGYVFADYGKTYIVYTRAGTPATLSLLGESGRYSVDWYDAVAGGPLRKGSVVEIAGGEAALKRGAHCSIRNRSEEHTSELQSLMRITYVVFCLTK